MLDLFFLISLTKSYSKLNKESKDFLVSILSLLAGEERFLEFELIGYQKFLETFYF